MNCSHVQNLFSLRCDRALSAEASRELDGHLAACSPCSAAMEEFRASLALLEELGTVEVADEFNEAVLSKLDGLAGPARGPALWKVRLQSWWSDVDRSRAIWSASPAMAMGAVLLLLATHPSGDSLPSGGRAPGESVSRFAVSPAEAPAEGVVMMESDALAQGSEEDSEEDVFGEMPLQLQKLLEESRDLRLPTDASRYREARYRYPLRRIPEQGTPQQVAGRSSATPEANGHAVAPTILAF